MGETTPLGRSLQRACETIRADATLRRAVPTVYGLPTLGLMDTESLNRIVFALDRATVDG